MRLRTVDDAPDAIEPTPARSAADVPPGKLPGEVPGVVRWWPLVAAGIVLELVWVISSALTYPLSASPAYAKNWVITLGPVWKAFEWLLIRLDARAPGLYSGDPPHTPAFGMFMLLLVVGYAAYLVAIGVLDRGLGSHPSAVRVVIAFALVFQVTLFLMPGILTTDLAVYAVDGRIAGVYGSNPWVVPPSAFPDDPFLPWWIARGWYTTTSPYGPLWLDLSWLIGRLTGGLDPIPQVLTYRLVVNAASLVNLGLVWWLLGRLAVGARLATFVAYAWSPLLLFQIAANGHNDALMLTFVLLAVASLARSLGGDRVALIGARMRAVPRPSNRAWLGALILLALGMLVKWVPALAAMFCAVAWLRCLGGWRQRLGWLGGAGVVVAVLTLLIAAPWLPGVFAPGPRAGDSGVAYANWLIDVPATWLGTHVLDRDGLAIQQARDTARLLLLGPALLALGVLTFVELRRVWRTARPASPRETIQVVVGASTRTILATLVLVSPQVQAWYFSWPLTLGLLLGWRTTTARVALAYSLLFPPVAYLREQTGSAPVDPLLVAYAVLPLALPAAAWLRGHPNPLTALLGRARGALPVARRRA